MDVKTVAECNDPGPGSAGGRPEAQLKLGLTKTMINNARIPFLVRQISSLPQAN